MRFKVVGVSGLIFLLLACAAPGDSVKPELVYLTDPQGSERFMQSDVRADYFPLASYLEFEQILTFCGPATMAAVLNSMNIERPKPPRLYPYGLFTQDLLFTARNQAIKSYATVEKEGLVLPEIAGYLNNLGVTAEYHHATELTTARLRGLVKTTLRDPTKRLIVNYSRSGIGQVGGGHISPLAAFDSDTDEVLILDVAKYKYPPVWVGLETLHASMNETDPSSDKSRGIVIVSE